jgi:hypothetical protein
MAKQAAVLPFLLILSIALSTCTIKVVVGGLGGIGAGEGGQSRSRRNIPPSNDWVTPRETEQRRALQSNPPVVLLATLAILVILLATALLYKKKRPLA